MAGKKLFHLGLVSRDNRTTRISGWQFSGGIKQATAAETVLIPGFRVVNVGVYNGEHSTGSSARLFQAPLIERQPLLVTGLKISENQSGF